MIFSKKIPLKTICLLGAIAVLILTILIVVKNTVKKSENEKSVLAYESLNGNYKRAAIVTNAPPCAAISKKILLKGGNAVDAIIAGMLCDGVTVPQSMGIGGGFFMIIYNKQFDNFSAINARETAPFRATKNMFNQNPELSIHGGLSVAIPGEIKGYWEIYKKFGGHLPWKELFSPTISLCESGIPINKKLEKNIKQYEDIIKSNEEFRTLFVNSETGDLLKEGEFYKNLKLAKTLRIIAENGGDVLYNGDLASALVKDIREAGGIITEEDLKSYKVSIENPLNVPILNNFTLFTMNAPSSGPILAYILRILNGLLPAPNELLNTHRSTEAFKYGYAMRSKLGDPCFVDNRETIDRILSDDFVRNVRNSITDDKTWNDPLHYGGDYLMVNDKGTANLAVISENGDAVVATSTINLTFGSTLISKSTGIILNNEMNDFSLPNVTNVYGVEPSQANFIEPGKRPMSSMTPSIIKDSNGDIKLLVGAAGGSKIITSVAITICRTLAINESIRTSIDHVLFHHQLLPMVWQYYPEISEEIVRQMEKIGHEVKQIERSSFSVVSAILKKGNLLHASCDRRRPGHIDGY